MSVMFWDIHDQGVRGLERNRVEGTEFDEVVYADDTICISKSEMAMNGLLAAIEVEGSKYGMRLNKSKCEYLKFGQAGNVKFSNGERVKQMEEVKYLGCLLNSKGDPGREIGKRIKNSNINQYAYFLPSWGQLIHSKTTGVQRGASLKAHVRTRVSNVEHERTQQIGRLSAQRTAQNPTHPNHVLQQEIQQRVRTHGNKQSAATREPWEIGTAERVPYKK